MISDFAVFILLILIAVFAFHVYHIFQRRPKSRKCGLRISPEDGNLDCGEEEEAISMEEESVNVSVNPTLPYSVQPTNIPVSCYGESVENKYDGFKDRCIPFLAPVAENDASPDILGLEGNSTAYHSYFTYDHSHDLDSSLRFRS